jgi:hypothetical protein
MPFLDLVDTCAADGSCLFTPIACEDGDACLGGELSAVSTQPHPAPAPLAPPFSCARASHAPENVVRGEVSAMALAQLHAMDCADAVSAIGQCQLNTCPPPPPPRPDNDMYADAAAPGPGTTVGASREEGEPSPGTGASASIWYKIMVPAGATHVSVRYVGHREVGFALFMHNSPA